LRRTLSRSLTVILHQLLQLSHELAERLQVGGISLNENLHHLLK
jgi:hypothetical protein